MENLKAFCSQHYRVLVKTLVFAITILVLAANWPGIDHLPYDASYYWATAPSYRLSEFPKTFRGCLYPIYMFVIRDIALKTSIGPEAIFLLLNALASTLFTTEVLPSIVLGKAGGG